MVNGIGAGGGMGRAAIEAALKRMQERSAHLATGAPEQSAASPSFADAIKEGVAQINTSVQQTDQLPTKTINGELDFHEVAAKLKESELSFEFALQVRNKFVEAYREVMRMNV